MRNAMDNAQANYNNIVSYHFVEIISLHQKLLYINLQYLKSEFQMANFVSKHWFYQSVYDTILPLFFQFEGETRLYLPTMISKIIPIVDLFSL